MSAGAAWDTHLRELRAGPTDTPGFDGALDLLSASALEADGEGREAMVRAGAWEVLLQGAEDAAAGGQWARASKAASCARTVAADPQTRTVLAGSDVFQAAEELVELEFSWNSAESVSRMPETMPALLRLARAGGHGEGGADADTVRCLMVTTFLEIRGRLGARHSSKRVSSRHWSALLPVWGLSATPYV